MIREVQAKSVLHYHERTFATNWDINPYRGCGHGCAYCFARYSHRYLQTDRFFDDIFVKTNVASILDRELSKRSWKRDPVCISGISDCYQPVEKHYELMPHVLETLIRHCNPTAITTKGTLILRDLDLLAKLAAKTDVIVSASITSMDPDLNELLEPGAPPGRERLKMLKAVSEVGCSTSVLLMPIMPMINDSFSELEDVVTSAKEAGADRVIPGCLHLRGQCKEHFFAFLKDNMPSVLPEYRRLFRGPYMDQALSGSIMDRANRARSHNSMTSPYMALERFEQYREATLEEYA